MVEELAVAVVVAVAFSWSLRRILQRSGTGSRSCCGGNRCSQGLESTSRGADRDRDAAAVIVLLLASGGLAGAAEPPPLTDSPDLEIELHTTAPPWWQRDELLSSGLRPRLADAGVELEAASKIEIFSCRRGGHHDDGATAVRGLVEAFVGLDLDRIGLGQGRTVGLLLQHASGNGISERAVGDLQIVSNIDAHDFTQISELWLSTPLGHPALRLTMGKLDANHELAAVDHGEPFINSSFGLIPTVPLPTYPDPAPGVTLSARMGRGLELDGGIFAGPPDTPSGRRVAALQLSHTGSALPGAGPTVTRLGLWYHNGSIPPVAAKAGEDDVSGNHGLWLSVDQASRPGTTGRRLDAFLQLGWAPADRNELNAYLGGGIRLAAPFSGRDDDVVGLGVAHAHLSGRLRRAEERDAETTVELFYRAQLLPWLAVQPDIQYIISPGGDGVDTLAVGVRIETTL